MIKLKLKEQKIPDSILDGGLGYKPYNKRVNAVITNLNRKLDSELNTFYKFPVYNITSDFEHLDLQNIYRIQWIENYICDIPNENQLQINKNFNKLLLNPHFETKAFSNMIQICVLSPIDKEEKNNFGTIVFSFCRYENRYVLVPLTQWIN